MVGSITVADTILGYSISISVELVRVLIVDNSAYWKFTLFDSRSCL